MINDGRSRKRKKKSWSWQSPSLRERSKQSQGQRLFDSETGATQSPSPEITGWRHKDVLLNMQKRDILDSSKIYGLMDEVKSNLSLWRLWAAHKGLEWSREEKTQCKRNPLLTCKAKPAKWESSSQRFSPSMAVSILWRFADMSTTKLKQTPLRMQRLVIQEILALSQEKRDVSGGREAVNGFPWKCIKTWDCQLPQSHLKTPDVSETTVLSLSGGISGGLFALLMERSIIMRRECIQNGLTIAQSLSLQRRSQNDWVHTDGCWKIMEFYWMSLPLKDACRTLLMELSDSFNISYPTAQC